MKKLPIVICSPTKFQRNYIVLNEPPGQQNALTAVSRRLCSVKVGTYEAHKIPTYYYTLPIVSRFLVGIITVAYASMTYR